MILKYFFRFATLAFFTSSATISVAAELTYSPIHPAFGGDPNYFNGLISLAQIQNRHVAESSGGGGSGVPEINFPPITIDLGGVGGTSEVTDPGVAATSGTIANSAAGSGRNDLPLELQ